MTESIMKISRLSRIIQILTSLQSGQSYSADDLAKMLGISRRTVFRDLKDLQKAGVPYHYDKKAHCYTISPEFFLPAPDLSIKETLGLLLLVYKARSYIHLPFMDSAFHAVLKIENHLPDKVKRFCNKALKNISIPAAPWTRIDLLNKIFVQLMEAVLRKQIVNVCYYLPRKHKTIVFDLRPCHLLYNEHKWYVLGKSGLYKGVRAFKLNQIKKLTVLDRFFTEDEEFDIHEHFGRAWSMIPEGKLYNVKLRFMPEVAHEVAEIQWHSTQTVTFEDDGSAIIGFRVDGLSEVTWWVLSYGDKVEVLAPRILRQKIIKIAQNTVKQNEQLLPI